MAVAEPASRDSRELSATRESEEMNFFALNRAEDAEDRRAARMPSSGRPGGVVGHFL